MPKVKKYKHAKKPKKRINKSIYKSNINKQHGGTNSKQPNISYMYAPAYSNLMDINSTIKGTMQELLTNHQQQNYKYSS